MYFDGALNLEAQELVYYSSLLRESSSNMSCKYTTRPPTMEQSTKL
jgi:hypothetical protein